MQRTCLSGRRLAVRLPDRSSLLAVAAVRSRPHCAARHGGRVVVWGGRPDPVLVAAQRVLLAAGIRGPAVPAGVRAGGGLLPLHGPVREHLERHVRHARGRALAPLPRRDPPQQLRLDVEVVGGRRGWRRVGLLRLRVHDQEPLHVPEDAADGGERRALRRVGVPAPLGQGDQVLGRLEREQRPLAGADVLARLVALQVVVLERDLARQQLEADHREAVHVRLLGVPVAAPLMLENLRRVPDAGVVAAGAGCVGIAISRRLCAVCDGARRPLKPGDLDVHVPVRLLPRLDEHVGRVQLAVVDLVGVQVLHPARDLQHDVDSDDEGERDPPPRGAHLLDVTAEVLGHELVHDHEVLLPLLVVEAVGGVRHVRVRHRREHRDLGVGVPDEMLHGEAVPHPMRLLQVATEAPPHAVVPVEQDRRRVQLSPRRGQDVGEPAFALGQRLRRRRRLHLVEQLRQQPPVLLPRRVHPRDELLGHQVQLAVGVLEHPGLEHAPTVVLVGEHNPPPRDLIGVVAGDLRGGLDGLDRDGDAPEDTVEVLLDALGAVRRGRGARPPAAAPAAAARVQAQAVADVALGVAERAVELAERRLDGAPLGAALLEAEVRAHLPRDGGERVRARVGQQAALPRVHAELGLEHHQRVDGTQRLAELPELLHYPDRRSDHRSISLSCRDDEDGSSGASCCG